MIDKLLEDVEKLAAEEMNRANLVHPPFHSRHEGVAVIEEEVRECEKEMNIMNSRSFRAYAGFIDTGVNDGI